MFSKVKKPVFPAFFAPQACPNLGERGHLGGGGKEMPVAPRLGQVSFFAAKAVL